MLFGHISEPWNGTRPRRLIRLHVCGKAAKNAPVCKAQERGPRGILERRLGVRRLQRGPGPLPARPGRVRPTSITKRSWGWAGHMADPTATPVRS